MATASSVATAASWAILEGFGSGAPGDSLTVLGALSVLAAYLLLPSDGEDILGGARAFLGGGAVAVGSVAAWAVGTGAPLAWAVALRVSAGAGLTVFLLRGIAAALTRSPGNSWDARCAVLTLGALLAAAPVWVGPALETWGSSARFTDFTVAICPLSYLSLLADHDYLRTPWFYEHCPIGSMRYRYPSALMLTAVYAGLGCLCWGLRFLARRPANGQGLQDLLTHRTAKEVGQ